ncbi:relaxase/mobilization nuclease domain-containing protein [Streptomyces sp. NPDC051561]|uniref:relaxase/mobilization nuclease domain-containing protein n=1 Tax=Streptomyces sp. NPDC051561 TaxID=3365658 RepID=UPI0037AAC93B
MIPKIHKRGRRTIGLLYYLYGPGTHEEHVDPHLVASWDDNAPDPGRDPEATLKQLQQLLDQPVENVEPDARPDRHVWHLSVRNAPTDRILSDEEWADVARRMVAATGIDPDDGACRWAAVRHADDHIHIVATLVREDGYKPNLDQDANRSQAEARLLEAELGLRRLNRGDGTAAQRPTSAERHKAARRGQSRTAREELREKVRHAAAGATSEDEFFRRLSAGGLLIRRRLAPSGDLLGYTVALPDDLNKDAEPVFYSGSKLAPDLSLPRIRQRWSSSTTTESAEPDEAVRPGRRTTSGPSGARRQATEVTWQAVLLIADGSDGVGAAQIAGGGEVLDALAQTSAISTRHALREAAFAYERASRSHIRAEREHDRALRAAARDLVYSGPALDHGEHGASSAMLIDMLFFFVAAAAAWHGKRHHAQQAAAARQAAEHLRAAYEAAAGQPLAVLRQRGRRLAQPLLHKHTENLRRAVPELADRLLAEPGWYALAATLAEVEDAGHDPAPLLAEAAARRELDTAESVSDVLVWRLRRLAGLPAAPSSQRSASSAPRTRPARASVDHLRPGSGGRSGR